MSDPTSSRILPWVQAVGFAAGAGAAAVAATWLRSTGEEFFKGLSVPNPAWLAELPDGFWTYASVSASAFLAGLVLWRRMVANLKPPIPLAMGAGALTANIAFFVMLIGAVSTLESWNATLAPFVLLFTAGWKFLLLGTLWGAIWGGLFADRPKLPPRADKGRHDTWD